MASWHRLGEDWYCWIGNGLHVLCQKTKVFACYPRKRGGRYYDKWTAKVVAGMNCADMIIVRQWNGGGDGNGNYRTLSEAKTGGLNDAEAVGKAAVDLVERIRSEG